VLVTTGTPLQDPLVSNQNMDPYFLLLGAMMSQEAGIQREGDLEETSLGGVLLAAT
jgi:hypothetical protein